MGQVGTGPGGGDPRAARARVEAAEALAYALRWRLPAERWAELDRLVALMANAWSARDVDALVAATAEVDRLGPDRVVLLGAPAGGPPPPPVHERADRLRATLAGIGDGRGPAPDASPAPD